VGPRPGGRHQQQPWVGREEASGVVAGLAGPQPGPGRTSAEGFLVSLQEEQGGDHDPRVVKFLVTWIAYVVGNGLKIHIYKDSH
jgi:hypothetical protein